MKWLSILLIAALLLVGCSPNDPLTRKNDSDNPVYVGGPFYTWNGSTPTDPAGAWQLVNNALVGGILGGGGNVSAVYGSGSIHSTGGNTPTIYQDPITSNNVTTALGYTPVQSVTATAPVASTGGQNPVISVDTTAFASNSTGQVMPDQQALQYKGSSYLTNSTANFRSVDSSGAVEVWFESNSTANFQLLLGSSDIGTATSYYLVYIAQTTGKLRISTRIAAGTSNAMEGGTNTCDGKWHHVTISSNGTAWTILLDGVAETLSVVAGSNTGDWFSDVTLRDNITLGAWVANTISFYSIADIGVTRIYSRPVLVAEALTNYQRGRKAVASDVTGLVFSLPLKEQSGNAVDTVGSLTMTRAGTILPTWLNSDGVFVAQGKTGLFLNSVTFNGTDNTIMTLPATSQVIPGVGQTNNWTASQNMTGQKITTLAAPTANGDAVRYENLTLPNANLSSTANQTSGGTTTANNVTFNTNDQLVGITHSTSSNTSQIWIQQSGAYLITFSAIAMATGPNRHIGIWLTKNNTNVANSDTRIEFLAPTNEKLITVTYIIQLLAGDYIELRWASTDDAGMILQALNSLTSPARPNCPSVILTINKVSN